MNEPTCHLSGLNRALAWQVVEFTGSIRVRLDWIAFGVGILCGAILGWCAA